MWVVDFFLSQPVISSFPVTAILPTSLYSVTVTIFIVNIILLKVFAYLTTWRI